MTGEKRKEPRNQGDAPRTDLPPTRKPYSDDYFGTGEEQEVVREAEDTGEEGTWDEAAEKRTPKGEDL